MSDGIVTNKETPVKVDREPAKPSAPINMDQQSHDERLRQKMAVWNTTKENVDDIKDALGKGMDEGIKETVIAATVLGINTTQSCEGHLDHGDNGVLSPWVDIGAPNEPYFQYKDQEKIFSEAGKQYGISAEEFGRFAHTYPNGDITMKNAFSEALANGESDEYREWREQSNRIISVVQGYLDGFYNGRQSSDDTKLILKISAGQIRLISGDDDIEVEDTDGFIRSASKIANLNEEERLALLTARRAEMAAFTDFLREKYFSQTDASEA